MLTIQDLEAKLRIKLDGWQREYVEAPEPLLVLRCGRKCGKTEAMAFKIVMDMENESFAESDGICILSRGQRQCREVFLKVRQYLAVLGYEFTKELSEGEAYATMTMIRLPNGNKLYALPCGFDGVTIRYYSFFKIYEDEAAYIPEAVEVAISACMAIYGKQRSMASTPAGTSGTFFDACHDPDYRRWHVKTSQCQRVAKEFLAREKRRMTKAEYAQEYDAEFTEDAEGIYPSGLIAACMMKTVDWKAVEAQAQASFIGVDVARFGEDKNCIAQNFYKDGINHVRITIITSKWRTTALTGKVIYMSAQMKAFKCAVTDDIGIGAGVTDMLIEKLGKRRVVGVQNHERADDTEGRRKRFAKTELHSFLLRLMETGKIVFEDDIEIVRSLRSMKYGYTKTGDLRIYGRNNHAAEAIVRAVFPVLHKKPTGTIALGYALHNEQESFISPEGQ